MGDNMLKWFGAWKNILLFQLVVKHGDESHGRIRKRKIHQTKQIQAVDIFISGL